MENNKMNKLNKVIEMLMVNDGNCGLDTLLQECGNDVDYTFETLEGILNRMLEDAQEENDIDNMEFYGNVLNILNK